MASNPLTADFDALVDKALEQWRIPGVSLSVIHDDNTWSKGYGLADRPTDTKVEPTTLFYAASTTKAQLCAVWAIYINSDANKARPADECISWTTPLADIIRDDFVLEDPVRTRQVTLEDAVSHRTGMPRHDLCYGKEGPNNVKAVTRHLRHLPLQHELRTKFEYCNTMYIAASHALEVVTGKHLSQILREWLWEPLGMKQTYLGYAEAKKAMDARGERLASSYQWSKLPGAKDMDEGKYIEYAPMEFPGVSGAGEVISTADDYAKWMHCLVSSSAPLNEAMTKELWTSRTIVQGDLFDQVPFDGDLMNYGLGWFICSYRNHKCYWHPGGIIGAGSLIMVVPSLKWGCSLFGNALDVGAKLRGLPFVLLDRIIGVEEGKELNSCERVTEATAKLYQSIDGAYAKARAEMYPGMPEKPNVPLSLPIEEYAGSYYSKEYGRFTFDVHEAEGGSKVLKCLVDNKTWTTRLTLEHANAEYWLGTKTLCESPLRRAFRAESKLGIDGKVEWFGLVVEDSMPKSLIWFKKGEDSRR